MSTTEAKDAGIPAEALAELEYAAQLAATGRKDLAFARKIAAEAARIREEVNRKYGLLDIGVAAIRELRDEMKYVLDSCVAFKTLLVEQDSSKAQRLCEEYDQEVHELLSPDVFPMEIAHAITRAERQGRISPVEGARLLTDMLNRLPARHTSLPLLPRAYHISSDERIGVYDCLYVALAEREGCELVTSDGKLIRKLQPRFPFIVPLASLP